MEAGVELSLLGKIISKAIYKIPEFCPRLKVIQYKIMPDHVHLIIQVLERLDKHIGYQIAGFKTEIANKWRKIAGNQKAQVFTDNYNDKIIFSFRSLDDVVKYVKQNPYRLAVRQARPYFFQSERGFDIDGRDMIGYGNPFLFRNPFKYPVIVHRADTEDRIQSKLENCRNHVLNNGIIVSAFISAREKEIRDCVINSGGKIILISAEPFMGRKKPHKMLFDLCAEGRLLILTPVDYLSFPRREHPTREQCLDMNNLAKKLSGWKDEDEEKEKKMKMPVQD